MSFKERISALSASAPRDVVGSNGTRSASMRDDFILSQSGSPPYYGSNGYPVGSPPVGGFSPHARERSGSNSFRHVMPKLLTPFATGDIRILLLENVDQGAVSALKNQGYQVDFHTKAFSEDELLAIIDQYHAIGIRSKTKMTAKVLSAAKKLLVIGCFCIGTNQVDLITAARRGICVFNSPFSNSRSVAELIIAEVISLSRQLTDRAQEMRAGVWAKVSKNCYEIRGKTLGIVGYGHIGSQLSVLAEAFGMRVLFYDVVPIMNLGSARQVQTLQDLLASSDFVTLHVPELEETKNMIGATELDQMKQGSYLINASRGSVVQIPALVKALKSGKLAGAALDVYPKEPAVNGPNFNNDLNSWAQDLCSCKNIILTPHIGGSTEEAQRMIGTEVSTALIRFINSGVTINSVNFPEVSLRDLTLDDKKHIRLIVLHKNQPGVLREVTQIVSDYNVERQTSESRGDIAYLMMDMAEVEERDIQNLHQRVTRLPTAINTRILY